MFSASHLRSHELVLSGLVRNLRAATNLPQVSADEESIGSVERARVDSVGWLYHYH